MGKFFRNRLLTWLVTEACLILWMSGHGDFLLKGEAWKFTMLGIAAGVAYWVASQTFTQSVFSRRSNTIILWAAAVGLRLLILPVFVGDDVWRYRWEGMIQLHGFNPYQLGPDSPALVHLRDVDWLKINHRDYAAIYPPLTEAIFAGIAALGNSIWSYKALFALADLASIAVLRRLLVQSGIAAENAAWYAWNPLVIYAFAGAAHFDSLMVLPLLGAICILDDFSRLGTGSNAARNLSYASARYWISALVLGLAVAVKLVPLVLFPVFGFAGRSWRQAAALLPVTLAPLAASALAYGFPRTPVFATLQRFGSSFRVNDPVWWLLETVGWPNPTQSNCLCAACILGVCFTLAYWFRREWQRGMLWVLGAVLLFSPVVHAWYVIWILPLAAWRGARAWFVFSISMFGYFLLWEVNHASGKPWKEPPWLRLLILVPPLVALGCMRGIQTRTTRLRQGEPNSLNSDDSTTNVCM